MNSGNQQRPLIPKTSSAVEREEKNDKLFLILNLTQRYKSYCWTENDLLWNDTKTRTKTLTRNIKLALIIITGLVQLCFFKVSIFDLWRMSLMTVFSTKVIKGAKKIRLCLRFDPLWTWEIDFISKKISEFTFLLLFLKCFAMKRLIQNSLVVNHKAAFAFAFPNTWSFFLADSFWRLN